MHILVAALYAAVLWLTLVAVLIYNDGPALAVLACGPIVVSSVIVLLYVGEAIAALVRIIVYRVIDHMRERRSIARGRL